MRLVRALVACGLLGWSTAATVRADDSTPVPQPTSPPVVVPQPATSPPVEDTPPPVSTPAPDISPVPVTRESSQPTVQVTQPQSEPPTASPPTRVEQPTVSPPVWSPQPATPHSGSPVGPSPAAPPASAPASTNPVAPPAQPAVTLPPVIDGSSGSTAAAAPAQLTCQGKQKGASAPFLSSPYDGWADINSFLDHDSPDYSQDGEIVIANGLTASASDGMASDFFPGYWSDSLRQYIYYDGHNGYDFGISYQPVYAAAAGTVSYAGWNGSSEYEGYGQMVLIDHHNGYITLYGHLSRLDVKSGDKVDAGQEIGISGSTGNSTGPHLHFSVFHNCQVTDPYGWIGRGADPLQLFDGERATYLWLPGEDPLVLNPPPDWPAFPLGVRVPILHGRALHHHGIRTVPPADRLLLLRLPQLRTRVGPGVAVARADALITEEAEALAPYLNDLRTQGLIETYQVMPAAAAVWVRGTASAAQLEGLPGVASLAGTGPNDLRAAEMGLTHSVLRQIGSQRAPSLWPVGFRSALHSWRPVIAVSSDSALVAGFALPGQRVSVELYDGGKMAGSAQTVADPESGGFVAMLHRASGAPAWVRSGDVVQVQSGGRSAEVEVLPFAVKARALRVSGQLRLPVTLSLVVTDPAGAVSTRATIVSTASGNFGLGMHEPLAAGSLAVATVVDEAGNQESAGGFVPGVLVTEGSSTVRGWVVGRSPRLRVDRRGKTVFYRAIHPAPDGAFQMNLKSQEHALALQPGDVVSVGSPKHQRRFTLPHLGLRIEAHGTQVAVLGSPGASAVLTCRLSDGRDVTRAIRLGRSGRMVMAWPGGKQAPGDTVSAATSTPTGDAIRVVQEARRIVLHEGSPVITGRLPADTALTIHALTTSRALLGGAVATGQTGSGDFSVHLAGILGIPVRLVSGVRLELEDSTGTASITVPPLSLSVQAVTGKVTARLARFSTTLATIVDSRGQRHRLKLSSGANGTAAAQLGAPVRMAWARLATSLPAGVTAERDIVPAHSAARARKHAAQPARQKHGRA